MAAALILMTVTVVTAVVGAATKGASRLEVTSSADRALRSEVACLRALSYCAASFPAVSSPVALDGLAAPDVVQDLFPHARPDCNTTTDYWVGAAETDEVPAGSFVTRREREGVLIIRVARFATGDDEPLPATAVAGWAVWDAAAPPAGSLLVRLSAVRGDRHRECRIVLRALPPALSHAGTCGVGGET